MASLQSIIVNQVIPSLTIPDLLQIQDVLQKNLTERIRNILRAEDTDNLFDFEISRITTYKSINLTPLAIQFVRQFPFADLVPMYVEDQLLALMRGESTIVMTSDGLPEITIYIYPTKNTVTIFNEHTIVMSIPGQMLLRGKEENVPFLSFVVHNLSKILF
jgi:hypothetical protein